MKQVEPSGSVHPNNDKLLRIELLGTFRVLLDGRAIEEAEWRLKKAKALVKLLALAPNYALHREQVLDLLWPELPLDAAANNLHYALGIARRMLEPPPHSSGRFLRFQGDLLVLYPGGEVATDVVAFEQAAARARSSRLPHEYQAAVDLYTGPLLPQDRYEDWAEQRREQLRQLHVDLLTELAGVYEDRGDFGEAADALGFVLHDEPTDENAHAGLMRLYALSGQRHRALRQYEQLKQILLRELDTEPDDSVKHLYQEIRAGRFPPDTAAKGHPALAGPQSGSNLPTPLSSFIGREREISELTLLLGSVRLLTLLGAGGAGKTRLALEVARQSADQYPDGTWLVELAGLTDPTLVSQAVGTAIGVREQPNLPLESTLIETLHPRKALLVLDNCEHLIDACAHVVEALLAGCPDLRLIATSRETLRVPGEFAWYVPCLSLPSIGPLPSVEELSRCEAIRLFVERARARQTSFRLTSGNAVAVLDICRRLGGIPLAIELAAAQTAVLPVATIAARLDDSLRLLVGGSRTIPRQQTLQATLDWSYDRLDSSEQELFRRLSIFTGGWGLEAAEFVGIGGQVSRPDVVHLLSQLVDKSLVIAELGAEASGRYRLLEPVRQYGRELLEHNHELEAVRRKHATFYLLYAEAAATDLPGEGQAGALERFEAEHDNLRAALAWSLESPGPAERSELGARLAGAMWHFWDTRGHIEEGRRWLGAVLADGEGVSPGVRARALEGAGMLAWAQGDYDRAGTLHEESLQMYQRAADTPGRAGALSNLGLVRLDQGRYSSARALLEESLELWCDLGDKAGISATLNRLGLAALYEGRRESARTFLEESLSLRRALGNTEGVAIALNNLGLVALYEREHRRARDLFDEALSLQRVVANTAGIALSLSNLGRTALFEGEYGRAAALCKESLALFHKLGERYDIAECLEILAAINSALGDARRCARLLGTAESLREMMGAPLPPIDRLIYDRTVVNVRNQLTNEDFTTERDTGAAMGLDQAVEYALNAHPN